MNKDIRSERQRNLITTRQLQEANSKVDKERELLRSKKCGTSDEEKSFENLIKSDLNFDMNI